MACSNILSEVALLPYYDRNATGVPGYSPAPYPMATAAECEALCAKLLYDCEAWTARPTRRIASGFRCWLLARSGLQRAAAPGYTSGVCVRTGGVARLPRPRDATITCSMSAVDKFSRTEPFVYLTCGRGTIDAVTFASYGRPGGACAAGSAGATSGSSAPARAPAAGVCHAASSQAVVRSLCVGLSSCTVTARAATFGADPCPGRPKRLIAQVACAAGKAVG